MIQKVHLINLLIMAELVASEFLFSFFLRKKSHYTARILGGVAACLLISFLFPVLESKAPLSLIGWGTVMYLSFFSLSGLLLYFCYEETIWAILFSTVAGQTLQNLGSSIRSCIEYSFQIVGVAVPRSWTYVTFPLVYILCGLAFKDKIKNNPEIRLSNPSMLILAGVAVFIELFLALVVMGISTMNQQAEYLFVISLYAVFSCIFILHIEFELVSNKALESELSVMSQLMKEHEKQYRISEDNIQMINLKCHDLKHQIHALQDEHKVIDREALKDIESAIGIYDAVAHTGNNALDILLTEKSLLCEKEGIRLTCMAEGQKMNFIAPADIYALFGNAIDNAIEAVMNLADYDQRSISVNIREARDILVIHVENYFDSVLVFERGIPTTTKKDKSLHGFGMKSMQMIAEKYSGYLSASVESNIFYLNILIPIPR